MVLFVLLVGFEKVRAKDAEVHFPRLRKPALLPVGYRWLGDNAQTGDCCCAAERVNDVFCEACGCIHGPTVAGATRRVNSFCYRLNE